MDSKIPCFSFAQADRVQVFGDSVMRYGFGLLNLTGTEAFDTFERLQRDVMPKLFGLDRAVKEKYETHDHQRGWTPFGIEIAKDGTSPDLKEFWHDGPEGVPGLPPNLYPEEVPGLREAVRAARERLDSIAITLLSMLEKYLGYEAGTLCSMTLRGDTILRLLHYPRLSNPSGATGIRAAAHEDINLITLLPAATSSGLKLLTRDGTWMPVNERRGMVVVNIGDMLQMFTEGKLPSATHCVENADGEERYSTPYFVHAGASTVIHRPTGYTAGEYLTYRLVEIGLIKGKDLATLNPPPVDYKKQRAA